MTFAMLVTIIIIVMLAAIHDARTGLIPDRVSLGGCACLLVLATGTGKLNEALSGACVAGGALGLLYLLTFGRGLGLGDVKLALAIGAALGPVVSLEALGLAFIFGAAIAVALLLMRRISRGHELYFAPYLAAGTMVAAIAHMKGFA